MSINKVIPFKKIGATKQIDLSPLDRDPRQFPYGLLLVEEHSFPGIEGFSWFASEAAAAHYLRTRVWEEFGFGEEDECETRDLVRYELRTTSRITEDWVNRVNTTQDDLHIVWFGTFEQLYIGKEIFAAGIVEGYREMYSDFSSGPLNVLAFLEFLKAFLRPQVNSPILKSNEKKK